MIELRWKIHNDAEDGPPPQEAIAIDGDRQRMYRVLQFRQLVQYQSTKGVIGLTTAGWSEWQNVKIC